MAVWASLVRRAQTVRRADGVIVAGDGQIDVAAVHLHLPDGGPPGGGGHPGRELGCRRARLVERAAGGERRPEHHDRDDDQSAGQRSGRARGMAAAESGADRPPSGSRPPLGRETRPIGTPGRIELTEELCAPLLFGVLADRSRRRTQAVEAAQEPPVRLVLPPDQARALPARRPQGVETAVVPDPEAGVGLHVVPGQRAECGPGVQRAGGGPGPRRRPRAGVVPPAGTRPPRGPIARPRAPRAGRSREVRWSA